MTDTERLYLIAHRNQEAERMLNSVTTAFTEMATKPIPFDPGNLFDLVIYDYDGEKVAKFPLEYTTYEEYENKLWIGYNDGLRTYRLDRFQYCIEGR